MARTVRIPLQGTFDVIGVLDVIGGRAVHARAGRRDGYQTIRRVAGWAVPNGDPVSVARAYVDRFGIRCLYLADLDAIRGGPSQNDVVSRLSGIGRALIVDGGIRSLDEARQVLESGASHVVVGLETLPSFATLDEIAETLGGGRVAFSLDLKDGIPLVSPSWPAADSTLRPAEIAERAARAGVGMVLLIDLARVGMGMGLDFALIDEVRAAIPGCRLIPGGGIRNMNDLGILSRAGCDGALVATALVSGSAIEH